MRRRRYQSGSLERKKRKNGPDVWVLRYREAQPGGSNVQRSVPVGDEASTQAFALSVTVTFVFRTENILQGYEPPAPPVLFQVPYDVFYPFLSAQSAAPRSEPPTSIGPSNST